MARRRGHALLHAALGALVFILLALVFVIEDKLPSAGAPAGPEIARPDQTV